MTARPVGEVFQLKVSPESLRSELVPSFDQVLDAWEKQVLTGYGNPSYVFEVTYFTEPLKLFIKKVADYLATPGVFGGSLEHGFGFGKTHSLIVLWHLFTSDNQAWSQVPVQDKEQLVKETLVLGFDFSQKRPFSRIISQLRVYARPEHPANRVKDPNLTSAVAQVLASWEHNRGPLVQVGASDLAILLREILERYKDLGGKPKLLILIDELGFGAVDRFKRFGDAISAGDTRAAFESFSEVNSVFGLLGYLYSELSKARCPAVVIWVFAEQDRREIQALLQKYHDLEDFINKVNGLMEELMVTSERYSRGTGGLSSLEFSYSPEHALEITLHRVFKAVGDKETAAEALHSYLTDATRKLNILEVFEKYQERQRRFYPFSPGMVSLLMKLMNHFDVPRTEYVRTAIQVASVAAEKALKVDAVSAFAVGVKHLNLPLASQAELMGELVNEWIQAVSDIEMALREVSSDIQDSASLAAKYLLAKGVTANVNVLLGLGERREAERYGSSIEELQLEILVTYLPERAFLLLDRLNDAMEELKMRSSRVDERDMDGKKLYFPSFYRTVYSALASFVIDEKKKLQSPSNIPIYLRQSFVPGLFSNLRVLVDNREVSVAFIDYSKIESIDSLVSDQSFRNSQRDGKLLLVLVPPWDVLLFSELVEKRKSYSDLVKGIADELHDAFSNGRIEKPLHVVVLVPDLPRLGLGGVLDKLATLQGTNRFIEYLTKMREEIYNRVVQEYESVLIKRQVTLSDELKKRHEALLRSKALRDVEDAINLAQRQLVRLSREVVAGILSLYSSVIYYSLDNQRFLSSPLASEGGKELESIEGENLGELTTRYTSIVNGYLADVVKRLGYKTNPGDVLQAVLMGLKKDAEEDQLPSFVNKKDLVSNIMLGAYGVKPINEDVAEEATKLLNNQALELDDKQVMITLDESTSRVVFSVRSKVKATAELVEVGEVSTIVQPIRPQTATAIPPGEVMATLQEVALQLPLGFNADDVTSRLVALSNVTEGSLVLVSFSLDTELYALTFELKHASPEKLQKSDVKTLLNLLSRLSSSAGKTVLLKLNLGRQLTEEKVKEVLGDYYRVFRSIDRFLP
jgi:hypothetical protein